MEPRMLIEWPEIKLRRINRVSALQDPYAQ